MYSGEVGFRGRGGGEGAQVLGEGWLNKGRRGGEGGRNDTLCLILRFANGGGEGVGERFTLLKEQRGRHWGWGRGVQEMRGVNSKCYDVLDV